MSGGYFDYQQYRLYDLAFDIKTLIEASPNKPRSYEPLTIEMFKEAETTLRRVAEMITRIDYLVSGDVEEDDFHKYWPDPEWQPIGTARKNHSTILLTDGKSVGIGYFSESLGYWDWLDAMSKAHPPTHWMPMPDPPRSIR